jgi:hypothetical protein
MPIRVIHVICGICHAKSGKCKKKPLLILFRPNLVSLIREFYKIGYRKGLRQNRAKFPIKIGSKWFGLKKIPNLEIRPIQGSRHKVNRNPGVTGYPGSWGFSVLGTVSKFIFGMAAASGSG